MKKRLFAEIVILAIVLSIFLYQYRRNKLDAYINDEKPKIALYLAKHYIDIIGKDKDYRSGVLIAEKEDNDRHNILHVWEYDHSRKCINISTPKLYYASYGRDRANSPSLKISYIIRGIDYNHAEIVSTIEYYDSLKGAFGACLVKTELNITKGNWATVKENVMLCRQ